MNTPEENKEQWQRVADAENPGELLAMTSERKAELQGILDRGYSGQPWEAVKECLAEIEQLQADFDRRTDILNNHIAREKVLEDALDKASNVFGQVAECVLRSGGSVPKEELMEIYRVCAEQALAAKEPTDSMTPYWRCEFKIEPRDLWMGLFWDARPDKRFHNISTRHFYICLFPTLLIHIFQEVR